MQQSNNSHQKTEFRHRHDSSPVEFLNEVMIYLFPFQPNPFAADGRRSKWELNICSFRDMTVFFSSFSVQNCAIVWRGRNV